MAESEKMTLKVVSIVPRHTYKTKEVMLPDRVKRKLYGLTALADALGRRPHTIRIWEYDKLIQKPLLKVPGDNNRYYLEAEIRAYVKAAEECGIQKGVDMKSTGFKNRVRDLIFEVKENLEAEVIANIRKQKLAEEKREHAKVIAQSPSAEARAAAKQQTRAPGRK